MLHLRWCCEKRCKKPTKTPVIRDSLVIRSPAGEVQRHFGRISVGELGGQWDILDPWTMWNCCQKIEWRKNATGSGSFNCRLLRTFSNSASLRKVQMRSLRWDEILEIWQKPENKNTSALSVYQLNVIYIGKTCAATSSFGKGKITIDMPEFLAGTIGPGLKGSRKWFKNFSASQRWEILCLDIQLDF